MSHANRGKLAESRVEAWHALYRRRDNVYVEANPRRVKVLGWRGKELRGVFEGESPPDYTALVKGRALLFDVKSTEADRWPLADLPEHQARHFDRWQANGGRAFVLLSMARGWWALPWTDPHGPLPTDLRGRWTTWAEGAAKRGGASLTVEDCEMSGLRARDGDWLGVVDLFAAMGAVG